MASDLLPEQTHSSDSFSVCVGSLRTGDDHAAQVVWDRFAPKLRTRVAERLTIRTRATVDSDDVLQSAFCSFFNRFRSDQFEVENWYALWQLLVTITDRKCWRQNSRSHAKKRRADDSGPQRTIGENTTEPPMTQLPVDELIFAETLEAFMESRDAVDRTILWLYLQGLDTADIADEVNLSKRSVQRAIHRAKSWLGQQAEEASDALNLKNS